MLDNIINTYVYLLQLQRTEPTLPIKEIFSTYDWESILKELEYLKKIRDDSKFTNLT